MLTGDDFRGRRKPFSRCGENIYASITSAFFDDFYIRGCENFTGSRLYYTPRPLLALARIACFCRVKCFAYSFCLPYSKLVRALFFELGVKNM